MKNKSKRKILGMLMLMFIPMFAYVCMANSAVYEVTTSVLPLKSPGTIFPSISSSKYYIDHEQGYIYTKTDWDDSTIELNINVKNGSFTIAENILQLSNVIPLTGNGLGDINLNGKVDLDDVLILVEHPTGDTLTGEQKSNADINGDNKITVEDARLILTYLHSVTDEKDFITSIGNKGDVNSDSEITEEDARMILQVVAGLITLNDTQKVAADVNDDGAVGAVDARIVLRYLLYNYDNIDINYDIVSISSSKYDLTKNDVVVDGNEFDKSDIVVVNGTSEYSNGNLLIKYYDEVLDTYTITFKTQSSTEKTETNPSTSDITVGNLVFIGVCLIAIVAYGLKKFRKINKI